jgi:hypothetical protein
VQILGSNIPYPIPSSLYHIPYRIQTTAYLQNRVQILGRNLPYPTLYTLYPTPTCEIACRSSVNTSHTLHSTPYTPHPTLHTLHPTPYTYLRNRVQILGEERNRPPVNQIRKRQVVSHVHLVRHHDWKAANCQSLEETQRGRRVSCWAQANLRVQGLGFRVWGLELMVEGSGFWVEGLGFVNQGL